MAGSADVRPRAMGALIIRNGVAKIVMYFLCFALFYAVVHTLTSSTLTTSSSRLDTDYQGPFDARVDVNDDDTQILVDPPAIAGGGLRTEYTSVPNPVVYAIIDVMDHIVTIIGQSVQSYFITFTTVFGFVLNTLNVLITEYIGLIKSLCSEMMALPTPLLVTFGGFLTIIAVALLMFVYYVVKLILPHYLEMKRAALKVERDALKVKAYRAVDAHGCKQTADTIV